MKRPILKLPDPPPDLPLPVLPMSVLFERINLTQAEDLLRGCLREWSLAAPRGTALHAPWSEVKTQLQPGDELWTYETWAECETKSSLRKGVALARKRRVIGSVETYVERWYWPNCRSDS